MPNTRQETKQRAIVRLRDGREWKKMLKAFGLPLRLKLASMVWWDYFSITSKPHPPHGDVLYPLVLDWLYNPKWADVIIPAADIEAALLLLGFGPIHAHRRAAGERN
jgi:hypothetical protein